ncbi:hypothetical protein BSKO_11192 [Bryopsis sp. KO-2023]|nr:hypothetical protein BSKO_11192 [Bryopsis sp. KO-2023]
MSVRRMSSAPTGLMLLRGLVPVPLEEASAEASVVDMIAEVKVQHIYSNAIPSPQEGTFVLVLDPTSVICDFSIQCETSIIRSQMTEIEQEGGSLSRRSTMGRSHQEVQLSRLRKQLDRSVFQINLGHLPVGKLTVDLRYFTQLTVNEDGSPKLVIPRLVCYSSAEGKRRPRGSIPNLKMMMAILARDTIQSVECDAGNLKSIKTSISGEAAMVDMGFSKPMLEGDVSVSVGIEDEPDVVVHALIERHEDCLAGMVSVRPRSLPDEANSEFVFLVDRSSSMTVAQMREACNAATLFLESLPRDSFFNLMIFSSKNELMFPTGQRSTEENVKSAVEQVKEMKSDKRRGVDLAGALKRVHSSRRHASELKVFILTGDCFGDHEAVCCVAKEYRRTARTFTLGLLVEDDKTHSLLQEIAQIGQGTSEFLTKNELQELVARQMSVARKQGIYDLVVRWGFPGQEEASFKGTQRNSLVRVERIRRPGTNCMPLIMENADGAESQEELEPDHESMGIWMQKMVNAPHHPPPVFDGRTLSLFSLFKPDSEFPTSVLVSGRCPEDRSWRLVVDQESCLEGDIVHAMAAKLIVRDLEEGCSLMHEAKVDQETIDVEVIELSCRYGVPSSKTAPVGMLTDIDDSHDQHYTGIAVAPPAPGSFDAIKSKEMGSARQDGAHGADMWRVDRKSIVRSFKVASKKLRFSVAYARFKDGTDAGLARQSSRKRIVRKWSGRGRRKPDSGGSASSSAPNGSDKKAEKEPGRASKKKSSVMDRAKMFEQQGVKNQSRGRSRDLRDALKDLSRMQASNGRFLPKRSLTSALGLSYEACEKTFAEMVKSLSETLVENSSMKKEGWLELWGTALAIAFMYEKLIDFRGEWIAMANKAEEWMSNKVKGTGVQADDIVSAAQQHIIKDLGK